jgi:hypothetical protein
MSSNVFPANLPGMTVEILQAPSYATRVLRSVSGKEVRASWRSSAITRIRVSFAFLRTGTNAPAPNAAYTELGLVEAFHTTHKGAQDSFLLDNSGGVFIPGGVSQPRVRFVDDELAKQRIVPGVWACELDLETVL